MGLLDHVVILFLVFWGTFILFSAVALPTYIPTDSVGGFPFFHTFSSIFKKIILIGGWLLYNVVVVFAIDWHESVMGSYVFPIQNPPVTSLTIPSPRAIPVFLFLVSYTSVRSIPFLSFIVPTFEWNIPLVSLIFLKGSHVFPFYCFPLFLCTIHWGRLSYFSLLFFGILHSNGYIFPFPLCL